MKKVRLILSSLLLIVGILLFNGNVCQAASVEVSTFEDLKKYLKDANDYTITITKNITVTGEINVYGKKKLLGSGKKLTRDSNHKDGRLFDLNSGANVEISNLNFNGNNITTDSNLIRVNAGATLTLKSDVKLSDAVSTIGGAALSNYGTVTTAAEFRNNTTSLKGGAIKNLAGGTLTVTEGIYADNKAGTDGGAIYVEEKSTCHLTGGNIYRNECGRLGEAIYAAGVTVNGAPEISSTNDIYIPFVDGLKITKCTATKKLPIYFYEDTVGKLMISNAANYINNLNWSHNFSNSKNHIIVAYNGGIYVGRNIVVTFHTENDEWCSTKSKTIKWGETYGTLPTPSRTGYHFVGWDVGKNVRPHITSSTEVKVDYDITLYAEWSPKVIELNFDVNGGDYLNTVWNATYDLQIWGLPTARRNGYEFLGWFDSPTGTTQYKDGDISKFAEKTVLYAHWAPVRVSVTLNAMGGSINNDTTDVYYEQSFGTMETPTRSGYVFSGWSLSEDGNNIINEDTKVMETEAFSLYAIWTPATYTVSFLCNGGSIEHSTMQVVYGSTYGSLPEATKNGYTFLGWYRDNNLTDYITKDTIVEQVEDHTLYAKWEANTYLLVFDPNGGSTTTSDKEVTYEKALGTLPVPVRENYIFKGWFTDVKDGEQYRESTILRDAHMVKLYARWEKIKVTTLQVKGIKNAYMVSDTIKEKDLTVTAIYNDGKKEKLSDGYTIKYTNKTAGKQKVVVSYKGVKWESTCYWYDKKTMQNAIQSKKTISLYVGKSSTITISNALKLKNYATFKSENKKIATVSKTGKITGKKAGTTKVKVTFTVNGKKTVFSITVKVKKPKLTISWSQKKGTLYFKAKTEGCSNVVWTSSNKKVGTIDKKTGVFKPKGQGTTYINAKAGGIKRVVKIVVKNGMYECYLVS